MPQRSWYSFTDEAAITPHFAFQKLVSLPQNVYLMHVDTIVALATPAGAGAVAIIRLSGPQAIAQAEAVFVSIKGKKLSAQKSHTLHLGTLIDHGKVIDQVLVALYRNPHSYTGEDVVEINCHGSTFIQQQIIQLFLRNGCRMAQPGEFTLRAFLHGKLDLSQAEAVADLIASDNEAAHQIALQQMRGGFSSEIQHLRQELLNFASLIELELDFAEEDVEFADRTQFNQLVARIILVLKRLIDSFAVGNVLKNGIPVAIVGEPNVGKSTLLNALLNEERAIVSAIAGTTRDTIEDELVIDGIGFRFIDTAGIRQTQDYVEQMGIQKTFEKITQAQVVLYLLDSVAFQQNPTNYRQELEKIKNQYPQKQLVVVFNKIDLLDEATTESLLRVLDSMQVQVIGLSAKQQEGVVRLKQILFSLVQTGALRNNETIVTNTRHYDALLKALEALQKVQWGMDTGVSSDLVAIDIREALYFLGEITGEVTNDELLGNIFANFCIGK